MAETKRKQLGVRCDAETPAKLAKLRKTPAFQALSESAEQGGLLSLGSVSQGAWGFLAAVLVILGAPLNVLAFFF